MLSLSRKKVVGAAAALMLGGCAREASSTSGAPSPALPAGPVVAVAAVVDPTAAEQDHARMQVAGSDGTTVLTRWLARTRAPQVLSHADTLWVLDSQRLVRMSRSRSSEIPLPAGPSEDQEAKALHPRPGGGVFAILDLGARGGMETYRHRVVEIDAVGSIVADDILDRMVWASGACGDGLTLFASGGGKKYELRHRRAGAGSRWSTLPVTLPPGVQTDLDSLACDATHAYASVTISAGSGSTPQTGFLRMGPGAPATPVTVVGADGSPVTVDGLSAGNTVLDGGLIFWVDYQKRLLRTDPRTGRTSVAWDGGLGNGTDTYLAVDQDGTATSLSWSASTEKPQMTWIRLATGRAEGRPVALKALDELAPRDKLAITDLAILP